MLYQLSVHLLSQVTCIAQLTVLDNTLTWLKGGKQKPLLGAIEKRRNKANTVWLSIPHFHWNILTVTRQGWVTWLRLKIVKFIKLMQTWNGTSWPGFTNMRTMFLLEIETHWIRDWVKPYQAVITSNLSVISWLSSCVQILSQVMSQSNYFTTEIECGALRHKKGLWGDYSVWETSENMGCKLKSCNFSALLSLFS